ncbi:hypothetical protein [Staphylococcus phage Sa30]|nr:hypothetical protein [Staphylococcus phage Sa30]
MSKETIRRQFSNAIEIMATTKEWWNFPKSFDTNKEFKIKLLKMIHLYLKSEKAVEI